MIHQFNPMSPAHQKLRYDFYPELLKSHPVYFSEPAASWVISRYAHVKQILMQPDIFSSSPQQGQGFGLSTDTTPQNMRRMQTLLSALPFKMEEVANANMLISEDPPRHTAMRRVFSAAFRPATISSLQETVRLMVAECMVKMQGTNEFDVVNDMAARVPLETIVIMLGAEVNRVPDFKIWADELVIAAGGSERGSDAAEARYHNALVSIAQYFKPLIDERRTKPGSDLISLVLTGQDSEARVTDFEVVLFVILMFLAGSETSTNLITNTVYELLQNPVQLQLVIDDPAQIPNAIEETLRFRSPVQQIFRKTICDTELGGQRIPKDAMIVLLLGASGLDASVWPDPLKYDLTRELTRSLGFGLGAHACLGMNLARLEAKVALEALIPELPKWRLAQQDILLIDNHVVWGYQALRLVRNSYR